MYNIRGGGVLFIFLFIEYLKLKKYVEV